VQNLGAIREQRRAALAEKQSPRIDFNEREQQMCSRATLICRQALGFGEELIVGEGIEGWFGRHVRL
jgi:hypothetical protein